MNKILLVFKGIAILFLFFPIMISMGIFVSMQDDPTPEL